MLVKSYIAGIKLGKPVDSALNDSFQRVPTDLSSNYLGKFWRWFSLSLLLLLGMSFLILYHRMFPEEWLQILSNWKVNSKWIPLAELTSHVTKDHVFSRPLTPGFEINNLVAVRKFDITSRTLFVNVMCYLRTPVPRSLFLLSISVASNNSL